VSKRLVKSLAGMLVISLRSKTRSQRSQKQLLLRPHLIFTTSIELLPILTRMLDSDYPLLSSELSE